MKLRFNCALIIALLVLGRSSHAASADLGLSAFLPPYPTVLGDNLVYNLDVTNRGPATATGLVISNRIPAGTTFVSTLSAGNATPVNGVLSVTLSSLPVGSDYSFQITVHLDTLGPLTNAFQVSANETDSTPADNVTTVISAVTNVAAITGIPGTPVSWLSQGLNPIVIQEGGGPGVNPIELVTSQIFGLSDMTTLPGDVVFLTDPNGGTNTSNWKAVLNFFNPADTNGSQGLVATKYQTFFPTNAGFNVFSNFHLFPKVIYVNAAATNFDGTITVTTNLFGPVAGVAASQEAIIVFKASIQAAPLTPGTNTDLGLIVDALDVSGPVSIWQRIAYRVTVTNLGPQTAGNVMISNRLPANVNFISANVITNLVPISGQGNYVQVAKNVPTNGVLLVNLGLLGQGAAKAFYLLVQPTLPGRITNVFRLFADQTDPALANNKVTLMTAITNAPPPGIPGTPYAGIWNPIVPLNTNDNGGQTIFENANITNTPQSIGVSYSSDADGNFPSNAIPGDFIILLDPNAGTNISNWGAVERFFDPGDPKGTNGWAATQDQAFFPSDFGAAGFTHFKLFPNVTFFTGAVLSNNPAPNDFFTLRTEIGPDVSLSGGQVDIFTSFAINAAADLSLQVTESPNPVDLSTSNLLTYSITVSNAGPLTATDVTVSNKLFVLAGSPFIFNSASDGSRPTNGVLLMKLGSLAAGATTTAQLTAYLEGTEDTPFTHYTNVFQVLADQNDPLPTNNFAAVTFLGTNANTTQFTTSTRTFTNNLTASVKQQATNFSTELIAVMPGTGIVYDQTFNVPFSDPSVQAGVTVAAGDLTGAGAISYIGPGQKSLVKTFQNKSSVLITNLVASNITVTVTQYVGPQTVFVGAEQSQPLILGSGQTDFDTLVIAHFTNLITTTITSNFLNTAVFTMTGTVASANLVLTLNNQSPVPARMGDFLDYILTISNTGPSVATGVILSNQLPASVPFGGIARTNGPLAGLQIYHLADIGPGSNLVFSYLVQAPAINGKLTNTFRVFANQTDPVPANNFLTVVSALTNAPVIAGVPGTPYAGSWATINTNGFAGFYEGVSYSQTFFSSIHVDSSVQSFAASYGPGNFNTSPSNAIPGDLILLKSPTGGNNRTNWAAVARFFNPADPTGASHLPATRTQAFFSATAFAGFTLFPNVAFYPGSVFTVIGPSAGILPGQPDITFLTLSSSDADLSLSASASPEPVGAGTNLVYTLTVTNQGPATANNVVISNRIPVAITFVSATGGITPTNGVLLFNLGSLAAGATNSVQVNIQPSLMGKLTNVFQVFANETDPVIADNSAVVVSTVSGSQTVTATVSTAEYDTNHLTTVSLRVTNFTTELIAKLPDGTVLYDQTFPAALADPTVQSAITVAAGDLTGAGATSYTGPTQTSFSKTTNNSSVTVPVSTNSNLIVGTKAWIGPATIHVGTFGLVQSYALDAGNTNYVIPTGGNPQSITIVPGGVDVDTMTFTRADIFLTKTNLATLLNSSIYVMTGVVSQVDVALSLVGSPNPVTVGAPLTYSLTVTNKSSVPASGVTVSNVLPANVSLLSALPSQGSATTNAGEVTYNIGGLTNGQSATMAIVVVPNVSGLLTDTARAFSAQIDSQPGNNRATNITTAVDTAITNLVLTVLSDITLNSLTGLYEQRIQVSNGGPATPASVRVLISGLPANAKLYNATGTTNGTPYVQSTSPLGVGSNIVFLLEYFVPTRVAPANLTLTVQAGPVVIPPVVAGTILNIDRTIVRLDGSVVVEFSAVPGQIYAVQYSGDMITWRTAVPAITAPTSRVQWIDSGPPKTDSNPADQPARYYRVLLLNH